MDQRDRLVSADFRDRSSDVQAQYRNDGTVALMTRTGVGILDVNPAPSCSSRRGTLTAEKQFNQTRRKARSAHCRWSAHPGLSLDLVQQNRLPPSAGTR